MALLSAVVMSAPAVAAPSDGSLKLVVGDGDAGFSGDGGPAAAARLNKPFGGAVGADGTLYIADTVNHRVRAVTPDGAIRTVAGNGNETGETGSIKKGTAGTAISLGVPTELAVGPDGTLYIADEAAIRVYALAPDGAISVRVDVSTGREILKKPMRDLRGLAVGPDGTIYVSDRQNNRVVAFAIDGVSRVVAGDVVSGPDDLAVDSGGDLWILGSSLYRVRGDAVATIRHSEPGRWAVGDGRSSGGDWGLVRSMGVGPAGVYLMDDQRLVVRWLSPDGVVHAVAELARESLGGDPVELAVGATSAGPLYLIDFAGSRVFAVDVPAQAPAPSAEKTPLWQWVLGGGAVVVLLAFALAAVRRQRTRTS
ncbi:hypothetical protein QLQ12_00940 [Actinoplanes sp. NEAU-A12]|uniref:NHL repeat-containing protein n=1 Tax=Actinoplanes sandaracinus TaxID=3045177 RepID=A0ABT6WBR3_9ACTN|nr:hypothetical protein [Actinoplanes sandaracinus]MDI6097174.1 hypothetical protein [Actinoplanes sandaracinus]